MDALAELVGESPQVVEVREQIKRLLPRLSSSGRQPALLLLGETGTGKTCVARLIHRAVNRRGKCVDINCAAVPENLLEAELFGYEAGAFTDARRAKPGLFQEADSGTIFLDEIGLLPLTLQAKLLKVLDERKVRRLGGTRSEPVNVLVVSATNSDLEVAVRDRRFREDLYHRIAVLTLWLPPLRDRGQDILLLADHFLQAVVKDYGLAPKTLTADARDAILAHRWPGNVRELSNVIERAVLSSESDLVSAVMLGLPAKPVKAPVVVATRPSSAEPLGGDERDRLLHMLIKTDWNVSQAAQALGLSRNTIRYRIDKLGLRRGMTLDSPGAERTAPAVPVEPLTELPASDRPVVRWDRRRLTFLVARIRAAQGTPTLRSSQLLEVLIEKARNFGGRVTDLSPIGLTAIFGLEPVEDAPLRGANAALAMRKAAERGDAVTAEPTPVRIGVHVAEAMVGSFSGTVEIDEAAKREAVSFVDSGIASVGADEVFVSDATAPFLQRRCDLVAEGALYRVLSCRTDTRAFGKRLARLVGRTRQLELLRTAYESARAGNGQVVGVTGETGIGKSRVVYEFYQSIASEPLTYAEGTCLSYGQSIPYLPVLELIKMIIGITDADDTASAAGTIDRALGELGIPRESAPLLLQTLGISTDGGASELRLQAVKARLFDVLTQIVVEASQRRPLVLVVEDLHWCDPSSEEYFTSLVERVGGAPILLIFTYRPGYRAPWIAKAYVTQIALPALARDDSAALVSSLLPLDSVSAELLNTVIAKADGNPFFLEELSRALYDVSLPDTPKVPDTVEEVLRARIDRLPLRERSVLQAAALLGRTVAFPLLSAVVDLPGEQLRLTLAQLVAAEFLRESTLVPEPEYRFKHSLTQDTAYQSLASGDRLLLHRRALEALEKLCAGRLSEHVERLAHHAVHGALWEKALTYCSRAGAKAAARSANREAVRYFDGALDALDHVPKSDETDRQAVGLRLRLRGSLWALGELDRIAEVLREAQGLAERLGDRRREGLVLAYLTHYFWAVADHDRALETGRRALDIASALGDPALSVETNFYLGAVRLSLGSYHQAADTLRQTIRTVSASGPEFSDRGRALAACLVRAYLARCLAELGEFGEALTCSAEALQIAEKTDHPFALIASQFGAGSLKLRTGEVEPAIAGLEQAFALCRGRDLDNWFPAIAASLGAAYAQSGRVSDALPLLERAVERALAMGIKVSYSLWVTYLGEAQLLAGRPSDARRSAERALAFAREHKERGAHAWALRLLGEIAASETPPRLPAATAAFQDAMAIAQELAMQPLLAHCHLGLGRAHRQHPGDATRAAEHLDTATALFGRLGMPTWRARVPTSA